MEIITGKIESAQKIIIYGPEGIGKSTFASSFPNPIFIDTEGSTKHMDVARTPNPSSWTMLLEQIKYFKNNPNQFNTIIIDTADWAERMCIEYLCARDKKDGLEGWGYGRGYTYLTEEFGRLLDLLTELIDLGINVVITAHAFMRKFEQPDELGAYDRWELKLQRKTAPMIKEWADMVLFANYKTHVVNVDGQGVQKGRNKVQGGKRVMYTTHHPCWDAKNRHGLNDELPFDYKEIENHINTNINEIQITKEPIEKLEPKTTNLDIPIESVPIALSDLMKFNNVTLEELQKAVESRGYYPVGTPFKNYDPNFIKGVLIAAWDQVLNIIKEMKGSINNE
ncbi:MAG: ATP-binding protein [Peptostreptococcales bacterium]